MTAGYRNSLKIIYLNVNLFKSVTKCTTATYYMWEKKNSLKKIKEDNQNVLLIIQMAKKIELDQK